jgi:geranylgeranyl diphosphate synthase type I
MHELKKDNKSLWPVIEAGVDDIFAVELLPLTNAFEYDQSVLLDYLSLPGRGIGGSLVLRFAQLYESSEPSESVLSLAAATEVINAAILMIDDVADNSDFRKRQATPERCYAEHIQGHSEQNALHSRNQALQLGMMTVFIATHMTENATEKAELKAVANIQHGAFLVSAGQLLESRVAVDERYHDEAHILAVHANKTGHYSFESPMRTGLLLAQSSEIAQDQFAEIGQLLGLAFQLQDDINGVLGRPEVTGKPNTDDVQLGVYTFIYHELIRNATPKELDSIKPIYGNPQSTNEEIDVYRDLIRRYEIDEVVKARAEVCIDEADKKLDNYWQPSWNPMLRTYLKSVIAFFLCQL